MGKIYMSAFEGGLDWMTFKGTFQPKQFYDMYTPSRLQINAFEMHLNCFL